MPFPTSGNLFYLLKFLQLWFRSFQFSLRCLFEHNARESFLSSTTQQGEGKLLLEAASASHPPDKNPHNRAVFGFLPSAVLHIFVRTL